MKSDTQRQEGTGSIRERVAELTSPAKLDGEVVVATTGPRLRRRLLNWAESGCYWSGLGAAYSWARRLNGAKILMYHSVAAPPEVHWIDPRNNIAPNIFRRHIEFLARHRRVVPLDDLVSTIERGDDVAAGTVAITFDDGYLNTLRIAAPILAEFGLPMTLCLPTGYMSGKKAGWSDRLYSMFRMRSAASLCLGLDSSRPHYLRTLKERNEVYKKISSTLMSAKETEREEILAEVENQLEPTAEPPRLLLDWDNVRELVRDFPDIEIGVHTVDHIDVSSCTKEQARQEILGSIRDVERELGTRPMHFSYPYSRVGTASRDVPRELGLRSALVTAQDNRVTSTSDRFALPRLEAPRSISRFGFLTGAAYPDLSRFLAGQVRHG